MYVCMGRYMYVCIVYAYTSACIHPLLMYLQCVAMLDTSKLKTELDNEAALNEEVNCVCIHV